MPEIPTQPEISSQPEISPTNSRPEGETAVLRKRTNTISDDDYKSTEYSFSQKEIKEQLMGSNNGINYKTLYQESENILEKMERDLWRMSSNLAEEYDLGYGERVLNRPISLLMDESNKLWRESRELTEENVIKEAQIDVILQMVDRLYTLQERVIVDMKTTIPDLKEDMKDGILNHSNNASVNNVISQMGRLGRELYRLKLDNERQFMETIKQLSDKDLLIRTLNIPEGVSAFDACYAEMLSRIGTENMFNKIDSIAMNWEGKNDNIKEALYISCMTTLLRRDKIVDLDKWFATYDKKDEIVEVLLNVITSNQELKEGLLLKIDVVRNSVALENLLNTWIQQDRRLQRAVQASEQEQKWDNVDIFSQKKVNGLLLFDNEGHGGGATFFQPNVDKFISKGFVVEGTVVNNMNMKKVILKKGNDRLTLILLKNDYEEVITNCKENYNLFALRGHCGSTAGMASLLGNAGMVKENAILIDGGCWNAFNLSSYKADGIRGLMFAYTGTGKGASTEQCVDKIFELKDKGGSFMDLLSYYGAKRGSGKQSNADYFANNTVMPDNSVYYNYMISEDDRVDDRVGVPDLGENFGPSSPGDILNSDNAVELHGFENNIVSSSPAESTPIVDSPQHHPDI